MKKLLFLCTILAFTAVTALAQSTATVFSNRNNDERLSKRIVTTDATPTLIDSVVLGTNEGGIVQVTIIGYAKDTAHIVTGIKQVRFNKRRGTLTLGTVGDILAVEADTPLSGATFSISASGGKVYVTVTGKASTSITWTCLVKQKTVRTGS